MKQWRKLTSVGKILSAHHSHGHHVHTNEPQVLYTMEGYEPGMEQGDAPTEDDSLDDEFRQKMQQVHKMRAEYDGLHKVAAVAKERAAAFADAMKELASYMADRFGGIQEDELGDVFLSVARVEEEFARLLGEYATKLGESIAAPTETLLSAIEQVEDTKKLYEEKRLAYEHKVRTPIGRSREGKAEGDKEQQAKEEFDEIAMTLGCRLTTLEQRRPRSLLTQIVAHHMAQMRFLKQGLQEVAALDPTIQRVKRERHIELDDDDQEQQEEQREAKDPFDLRELDSEGEDERVGSSSMFGERKRPHTAPWDSRLASPPVLPGPVIGELRELPKEMPAEWSSMLSSLDQTLKGMGAETMDVSDAVFAMNAVLSAAVVAKKEVSVLPHKSRGIYGSYSAPLSSQGTPLDERQEAGSTTTASLPPGFSVQLQDSATSLPAPSSGAAESSGLEGSSASGSGRSDPAPTAEPLPRLASDSTDEARDFSTFNSFASASTSQWPSARGFVSRSGPIYPSRAGRASGQAGAGAAPAPAPIHMSGPLPSPSDAELAQARARQQQQQQQQMRSVSHHFGHSSPADPLRAPRSSQAPLPELPTPRASRQRFFSGPLDHTGQMLRSASGAGRGEPLHKSGPLGRSPLGTLGGPSAPQVTELHKLPPPPLNSSAPTSFATTPAPSVSPTSSSLKAPPGHAPLPLSFSTAARSAWAVSHLAASQQAGKAGVLRSGAVSKKPSVPTILSEGSEEGESPGASSFASSPRLFRSLSLSSTESAASSTLAPLRGEELAYVRALDKQGAGAGLRSAPGPPLLQSSEEPSPSTLSTLGSEEQEQLLEQVSRDDFRWRWIEQARPGGVPTVPDWSGMPPSARLVFLKALASAVVTRRTSDSGHSTEDGRPGKARQVSAQG